MEIQTLQGHLWRILSFPVVTGQTRLTTKQRPDCKLWCQFKAQSHDDKGIWPAYPIWRGKTPLEWNFEWLLLHEVSHKEVPILGTHKLSFTSPLSIRRVRSQHGPDEDMQSLLGKSIYTKKTVEPHQFVLARIRSMCKCGFDGCYLIGQKLLICIYPQKLQNLMCWFKHLGVILIN